ncbi:hypothetical protein D187_005387 [Cystobacter fuscus DSM 2262]|uniref:DUF2378 family protein n=1 Tax=Cystobacter fuscus (strain ATCC 25194 / DSM 2262 / NBRC 100088 / M29) TaxID=1242864 RepID=S9R5K8_CYSF2|nr:DUF2378 family protein [Cystobacter fuscus]EPX64253.1 hypothetical protein D187_005387 [Cystobacter fuscus DSM 2262]
MSDTPLVFNHTVQGLFSRAFPQGVPALLKEKLRAAGVDLDRPLLPAYPIKTWSQCIALSAPVAFPNELPSMAWHKLGERMIDGYQETMIGRAMFASLRLLGPRRMLQRAKRSFRSGNNYTEVQFTDVSETEMDLWFNETDEVLRHFTAGLVMAGMRMGGAELPQVGILHTDSRGVTFRATWAQKGASARAHAGGPPA